MSRWQAERLSYQCDVSGNLATMAVINFADAAGGTVFIPTGSSITTLTYYAAPYPKGAQLATIGTGASGGADPGYSYLPLNTATGTAVTQTVAAGQSYNMPPDVFGCGSLKIVANIAGKIDISIKG